MDELSTKPDYLQRLERVEAWFQGEILDRVPIRLHRHNAEYDTAHSSGHPTLCDRWFDAEYQAGDFLRSIHRGIIVDLAKDDLDEYMELKNGAENNS